jgi:hypothetical protein
MWHNLRNAIKAADEIMRRGHIPVIPHLSAFWAMSTKFAAALPESVWLDWGLYLVERCDALLRISGRSNGSDGEVARAMELDKPVWRFIEDIPIYMPKALTVEGKPLALPTEEEILDEFSGPGPDTSLIDTVSTWAEDE